MRYILKSILFTTLSIIYLSNASGNGIKTTLKGNIKNSTEEKITINNKEIPISEDGFFPLIGLVTNKLLIPAFGGQKAVSSDV